MNIRLDNSQLIKHVLMCAIAIGVVLIGPDGPVYGQDAIDDVKQALKNGDFPWYDSRGDEIAPVELPAPKEAASKNRNALPKYVPKTRIRGPVGPRSDFFGLSVLAWVVIGLVIALVVGLLIWAFVKMENRPHKRSRVKSESDSRTREERIKELPFDLTKTKGDFREMAHAAYQSGDYRIAMTFLFSHVL